MKNSWWKYLGVLIILYSLIGGMIIPLGAGILKSTPFQAEMGQELELQVSTYNFVKKENVEAYLRLGSHLLKANDVRGRNAKEYSLHFSLPEYLPVEASQADVSLILYQPGYGAAVLPSALFLKQEAVDVDAGLSAWIKDDFLKEVDLVGGMHFPFRSILYESIRNTYYHVPMWFAMIAMFTISLVVSILLMRDLNNQVYDLWVLNLNRVGVLFGILGLLTGAIWARYTWGSYWSGDIKQNMSAICLLIYGGYFVLRATVDDLDKKRRISAIFNVFAYIAMIPLLFVIPRMTDSLHPGSGGNPAMGGQDLDSTMRLIFYPAIIGWILFGIWIAQIGKRLDVVKSIALSRFYNENE